MIQNPFARLYGGVAYHEEDRGDEALGGGGGVDKEAEAAKAAEAQAAAKVAEAAEAKRVADKAEREKNIAIPKARHDEAVGKERTRAEAAEKEAAELKAEKAARTAQLDVAKVEKEIDDLNEALDKALADNNPAEKQRIRAAIRAKERSLAQAEAKQEGAIATALAVEQVRYDAVVDAVERDYPFLAEGAENYNEALTREVLELKAGFEGTGLASSAALKKALKFLKPQLEDAKKALAAGDEDAEKKAEAAAKKAAEEEAARVAAAGGDAAAKKLAEEAEAKRRAAAVAKGTEAKDKTPANPAGAGGASKDIKQVDVKDLSEKDFDALPEAEKKRLRGD